MIHGVGRIGKVLVFAGLIMSGVFLGFVTGDDFIGKMFGLGLGLAILIDVLIARMVVAPAVLTLLGDHAWWLPGWLNRLLPNVSLEGSRTTAAHQTPEPPAHTRGRPPAQPAQPLSVVCDSVRGMGVLPVLVPQRPLPRVPRAQGPAAPGPAQLQAGSRSGSSSSSPRPS